MNAIVILAALAAVAHMLHRATRIPVIPLLLGLGMAASFTGWVSHSGLNAAQLQSDPFVLVMELGLTVLVFASGLELNPRRFRRQRRSVLYVGLLQFTLMGGLGYLSARWLGYDNVESTYLGFAVSASSTLVVLRQLRVTQHSFEPHGRMVIGVLLLQDVLTIAVLIVLTKWRGTPAHLAGAGACAAGLSVAAWLIQRHLAKWLLERCRKDEESMLLMVLSILFLFLGAAHWCGLPIIVGAFLAGYSLSSFPANGLVGGLLLSLTDFFRAIFFVALGTLVTIPEGKALITAGVLIALIIVVTPPVVAAVAEWAGFTARPAIESGLLLAQTSEYSLILGLTGLALGDLGPDSFSAIALMAVVTMTLTPFLAREEVAHRLLRFHPLRRQRRRDNVPREVYEDHVLVLGFGTAGMWILRPLQAAKVPFLIVDDDPAVIRELDKKGLPCLRGDASDEDLLSAVGARRARLIISSLRRVHDAREVIAYAGGAVPVLVRVFEDEEAEAIRQLGGIPVLNSEAAITQFMAWFEANVHSGREASGNPAAPLTTSTAQDA